MINQETVRQIDGLLKTKIPLKRTAVQRNKSHSTKFDDNGSSSDEKGKDGPDSDYDSEVEREHFQQTNKRLNDGHDGIVMANTNLQSSVAKSIEASKSLPIAKHKDNIMSTLERNRVLIISGDTGCG